MATLLKATNDISTATKINVNIHKENPEPMCWNILYVGDKVVVAIATATTAALQPSNK